MATANLERLRRNLRMTQTQYAELMNQADESVRETCEEPEKLENRSKEPYKTITISRMENKADLLSGVDWLTYKNALGLTDEQLVELIRVSYGLTKPEKKVGPLEMENTQEERDKYRKKLDDLAGKAGSDSLERYVKRYTKARLSKPKIAFVGASNAGKTTIIASLLGNDADGRWLPTSWQRETNAVCLIRHMDDRPQGNSSRVLAFEKYEDIESGNAPLETGGYELLEKYTSHSKAPKTSAEALLIYSDAPILKNCDLIDMPGYRSVTPNDIPDRTREEKEYDEHAFDLLQQINWWGDDDIRVDAVFFVSMMENDDFCRTEDDLNVLLGLMRRLCVEEEYTFPADFYIVASHARNAKDAKEVLRTASHRIWEMLNHPELEYDTEEDFAKIFSTFDLWNDSLTKEFHNSVENFLEEEAQYGKTICKEILEEKIRESCARLEDILRRKEEQKKKKEFSKRVEEEALKKIETMYDSIINEEHIVEIINKRKLKRSKEDVAALNSYLRAELNNGVMNAINAVKKYYAQENVAASEKQTQEEWKAKKKDISALEAEALSELTGAVAKNAFAAFTVALMPTMVLAGTAVGLAMELSKLGGAWKKNLAQNIEIVYAEEDVKSKLRKSAEEKLEKFKKEYKDTLPKISEEKAQKELTAGRKFLEELSSMDDCP